jgi:hypothetical protein
MPRSNKRKLSEYDLAVRVIFEEISEQLGALVAMQKRYEERRAQKEYRAELGKQGIIPKIDKKLAV